MATPEGGALVRLEVAEPGDRWDEEVGERALELPGDLCGAPLLPAG